MDSLGNSLIEDEQMMILFRFLYDYTYFKEGTAVQGYFSQYHTNFGWTFNRSDRDIKLQKDGYNCGVFAVMFSRAAVMDQNPTKLNSKDAEQYRLLMFERFYCGPKEKKEI